MSPIILVCGKIVWAQKDMDSIIGSIADVRVCESKDRAEFKQDLETKYKGVVGIYRQEASLATIGAFDADLIALLPDTVKYIAQNGAGYDHVDVHAALERGIQVAHTPGAVDSATATTACWLIIAALRQYWRSEKSVRAGNWKRGVPEARDPDGRTLGIVGMGGIGAVVAKRMADGWGMKILYHNRRKIEEGKAGAEYEYCESLEDMLGRSDVVSLNLPLNAQTEKSFGAKQFGWMKDSSVLVNTARGGVVDEPALIEALKSGKLYSAGLDVFPDEPNVNPEFLEFDNVILLPHAGTETSDTRHKMEMVVIRNLEAAIKTGKVVNLVPEQKSKLA